MIDLHYWPTPNGKKVTILLEECGLPYKIVPVNIGRGDQFSKEFLEMNPNHRMPVMVGFNIPVFGKLDHLSIEGQWYGAPFHDDLEPYRTGEGTSPTVVPVGWQNSENGNADKNVTRDNWKWSLHGAKTISGRVRS